MLNPHTMVKCVLPWLFLKITMDQFTAPSASQFQDHWASYVRIPSPANSAFSIGKIKQVMLHTDPEVCPNPKRHLHYIIKHVLDKEHYRGELEFRV